jgi:hypothetical protein
MAISDVVLGFLSSWKQLHPERLGKTDRRQKKERRKNKDKTKTKQTSYAKSFSEAPWCIQAGEEEQ